MSTDHGRPETPGSSACGPMPDGPEFSDLTKHLDPPEPCVTCGELTRIYHEDDKVFVCSSECLFEHRFAE